MAEDSFAGDTTPPASGTARTTSRRSIKILAWCFPLAIAYVLGSLLIPATAPGTPGRRITCSSKLQQIALALQNYAHLHGALPAAYTTDATGKPLHSWRTLLLPFLERKDLYDSIDLTKPWDDPVNAAAREMAMDVYRCPSVKLESARHNYATYLAVLAPDSCLRPTVPRSLAEISDGPGETLMLIEVDAAHAVHWMSPVDVDDAYVLGIGSTSVANHSGGVNFALANGHVRFMPEDTPAAQRLALISATAKDEAKIHELP